MIQRMEWGGWDSEQKPGGRRECVLRWWGGLPARGEEDWE